MLWHAGGSKLLVDRRGLVTDQQTIKGNMPTLNGCHCGILLIYTEIHPSVAQRVCCPSHMCLLHMVSIEVCGNVGQEIGHGLKEYTGTRQQLPHF